MADGERIVERAVRADRRSLLGATLDRGALRRLAQLLADDPNPALVETICQAAADKPGGRLTAFCVEHGLAPADPVDRAVFYLVTGQNAAYEALDPDGALTGAGYRTGDAASRARLRVALTDGGRLDRLTALAREHRPEPGERHDLARAFAGRRDWAAVWSLAENASLLDAVDLVGLLPSAWQPADGPSALLDRIRAAPADVAVNIPLGYRPAGRLTAPHGITGFSFAPDGAEVVIQLLRAPQHGPADPMPQLIGYALPDLTETWRQDLPHMRVPPTIAHAPGGVVVARTVAGLVLVTPDGRTDVTVGSDTFGDQRLDVHTFLPLPTGFAAVGNYPSRLVISSDGGRTARNLDALGLQHNPLGGPHRHVAADPRSGHLAVALHSEHPHDGDVLMLGDATGRVIASGGGRLSVDRLAVLPSGRLLVRTDGLLQLWAAVGDRLELVVERRLGERYGRLTVLPAIRLAEVGSGRDAAFRAVDDLTPVTGPSGLPAYGVEAGEVSPDGGWIGQRSAAAESVVDLYAADRPLWLEELVARPFDRFGLAELGALERAEGQVGNPAVRSLVALLRTAVEQRFDTEITLGAERRPPPADTDISL